MDMEKKDENGIPFKMNKILISLQEQGKRRLGIIRWVLVEMCIA